RRLDSRGDLVRRTGSRRLPAEELAPRAAILIDDHTLPPIVHAEGNAAACPVDELKAQMLGAVGAPVAKVLGAEADIAQSLWTHASSSSLAVSILCEIHSELPEDWPQFHPAERGVETIAQPAHKPDNLAKQAV